MISYSSKVGVVKNVGKMWKETKKQEETRAI